MYKKDTQKEQLRSEVGGKGQGGWGMGDGGWESVACIP